MKILVLSPVYPYPPDDGDRLRIFNAIKQLSKKNRVHLVAFAEPGERQADELAKLLASCRVVTHTKAAKMLKAAAAVFTGEPLNCAAYGSAEMRSAVAETLAKVKPDVIYAYRLRMAQYCEKADLPKVIDAVDSLARYMAGRLRHERSLPGLLYTALDLPRISRAEKRLPAFFDRVLFNSGVDLKYLGLSKAGVMANGVNIPKPGKKRLKGGWTAGFFGNMAYPPNADALAFLVKNIWKKGLINDKSINLLIAGKGSEKAAAAGIQATGYVADLDAEIASWGACFVPVRYGAGLQNKVLQAWANRVPVVASPFAASGVGAKHGKDILVAESPADFAAMAVKLKNDSKLAKRISNAAFRKVKKEFNWERSGKILEKALKEAVRKHK